jgi:hypothetical protein
MRKNRRFFAVFALCALITTTARVGAEEEMPDIGADVPTAGESLPSADLPTDVTGESTSPLGGSEIPSPAPSPTPEAELASDPEPETTPTATEEPASLQAERPAPVSTEAESVAEVFDPRVPLFQQLHPRWAIDVSFSMKPYKGQLPGASASNVTGSRGITLRSEYQPAFLSKIGVVGIGPSLTVYPLVPTTAQTGNAFGLWSIGAQLRYQARFFRNQILVPWAGFAFENFRYGLSNGTKGTAMLTGPFFGGGVLLNALDGGMAADFYSDHGVLRTYAFAEIRALTGASGAVNLSESSVFFGLRFEL